MGLVKHTDLDIVQTSGVSAGKDLKMKMKDLEAGSDWRQKLSVPHKHVPHKHCQGRRLQD